MGQQTAKHPISQGPSEQERVEHDIEPVFDERSQVLLLGTMPSPASREAGFFYGHPRNRLWSVLAALFDEPQPRGIADKRDLLLRRHIALWDVLSSCEIDGAGDASIRDARPNDLARVLDVSHVKAVFATGSKAGELYRRLCEPATGIPCTVLPSTSPANAKATLPDLVEAYRVILSYLDTFAPPVLDVPQVVHLEQAIAAAGTSLECLMQRAGRSLAYRVSALLESTVATAAADRPAHVCVLCGSGNNGGDGWVAACELADEGAAVTVVTPRPPVELSAQPAHDVALRCAKALSSCADVRILTAPQAPELQGALSGADVIVDAVLGTGFSGASVRAPYDGWIRAANEAHRKGACIVAADVPSGLSAQTGAPADPCIVADETVTMICSKPGLTMPSTAPYRGKVYVAPIAYIEGIVDMKGDDA